jgi:4-hydroxybutyrate CoA-transferase
MNWKDYYREKTVTADQAAGMVKSGDRLVAGHATGSPETLLEALVANSSDLEDVEIVHMVSMGKSLYCRPEYHKTFRHNSLFAGGATRALIAQGKADYTPCFFKDIPGLFKNGMLPVDVAMITVSPPDKSGNVSLGVSVDYTLQAALSAKTVIAEVTPHMPSIPGTSFLHVSQIDAFVETDRQLIAMDPPAIGEVEKNIGANVAELIQDGDCLQLGIGAIPDAVLTFLDGKKDLGIHSEMISDGVMHLAEKGVITCRKKNLHPYKIIITFAMGTPQFYQWLDNNSMVEIYPVDYTNDPFVVAQNDNLVSINSAISVDLLGQVAADTLGTKQFSGVGGQVDFVRGAKASKRGRSIIAIPATAAKGKVSRIVPTLAQGQAVTTSRNDVDFVVTEFGIAQLRGKTVGQRAKALIDIAHPDFKDNLKTEFEALYLTTA